MPTPAALPSPTSLLVRPVHLAGPGDPRLITNVLDTSPGWSKADTATGVRYSSPCRRVIVTHVPGEDGGWDVRGYLTPSAEPLWAATFGHGTPAEITATFVAEIVDGLHSNHRAYLPGGSRYRHDSPAAVLADRGWQPNPGNGYHDQVSPDGRAVYRHRIGYQPQEAELAGEVPASWAVIGLSDRPNSPLWQADFTIGVPFYALTRAALVLSGPWPVKRRLEEIPEHCRPYITARPAAPAHPRRPQSAPRPPAPATPPPAAAPTVSARRH